MKLPTRNPVRVYLWITAAAFLYALGFNWCYVPNQIAFGVVAPSGQAQLILPIAALLLGVAVSSALIGACRNLVMQRVSTKLDVIVHTLLKLKRAMLVVVSGNRLIFTHSGSHSLVPCSRADLGS